MDETTSSHVRSRHANQNVEHTASGDMSTQTSSTEQPLLNAEGPSNGNERHVGALLVGSTPGLFDSPEVISGVGHIDWENGPTEDPQFPVQDDRQDFGSEESFESPGWVVVPRENRGQADLGSFDMEQPIQVNSPDLPHVVQEQYTLEKPDCRFADPQNIHDQISIQYALLCTRKDCRARLGVKTMEIRTTPEKCYGSQWLEIQRRFAELWPLRGDGEAPVLVQVEAWTGRFDNWKEPT